MAGLLQLRQHFHKTDVIVVIFHDHGTRYLGKMFNDEWMRAKGFLEVTGMTARDLVALGVSGELHTIEGSRPVDRFRRTTIGSIAAAGLLRGELPSDGRTVRVAAVQGNVPEAGLEFNAERRAVNDNRRAGGFGASSIATVRSASCISAGCPGKSEQTWPSSPTPRMARSNAPPSNSVASASSYQMAAWSRFASAGILIARGALAASGDNNIRSARP